MWINYKLTLRSLVVNLPLSLLGELTYYLLYTFNLICSSTYPILRNLNLILELSDKKFESSNGSSRCSYLLLAGLVIQSSKNIWICSE